MKTSRGFIPLGLILALILGLAILGGAGRYAYWSPNNPPAPHASAATIQLVARIAYWSAFFVLHPIIAVTGNHLSVSPNSGKAPLDVDVSVEGTELRYTGKLIVDFGDHQISTRGCAGGCSPHPFQHTYVKSGSYKVTAIVITPSGQVEQLGSRDLSVY